MARVLQYDPFHQPCSNFAHTRKTVSSTFRSATLFPLMILLTNRQRVQLKDTGPPSPARRWPRKIACKEGDSWLMRQDPPRPDSCPASVVLKKYQKILMGRWCGIGLSLPFNTRTLWDSRAEELAPSCGSGSAMDLCLPTPWFVSLGGVQSWC